ncbi:MAG TPA: DUF4870 domain-containing protein [Actinomycetota bacterium]|nr:DUF4870 domain-containing protein [Actinomycetota bacterium]
MSEQTPPPQWGPSEGDPPGGQQPYGPPPGAPPPLPPDQERTWGMLAHLSAFVAAYVALGFLGPLVVMLVFGPRSAFVREHAVEALNFNLTWLIYIFIAIILAFVLIGIPILIALGIAYLVFVVIAAVRANAGEHYRYPGTIRFVR